MFEYRVSALCSMPVKEVISPYLDKLTPSQMRKRSRESLATLREKLSLVPHIENVTERQNLGDAVITTYQDVSIILKELDLCVIEYGKLRKFPIGTQCLMFIRATQGVDNTNEIQEKIKRIIKDEFDGKEGPYPYTFLVAIDDKSLWLPNPEDRKNAWIVKLREIERHLLDRNIRAELGKYRLPERLS